MAAFPASWARKSWNVATLVMLGAIIALPLPLILIGAFFYEPLLPYSIAGLLVTMSASARPKVFLSLVRRANGDLASAPPIEEINRRLGHLLDAIQVELSRRGVFFVHGNILLIYHEGLPGTEPRPRARLALRGRNGDAPSVDLRTVDPSQIAAIEQSLLPEVRNSGARRRALFRQIDLSHDVAAASLDLSPLSHHDLLKRSSRTGPPSAQVKTLADLVEVSLPS